MIDKRAKLLQFASIAMKTLPEKVLSFARQRDIVLSPYRPGAGVGRRGGARKAEHPYLSCDAKFGNPSTDFLYDARMAFAERYALCEKFRLRVQQAPTQARSH